MLSRRCGRGLSVSPYRAWDLAFEPWLLAGCSWVACACALCGLIGLARAPLPSYFRRLLAAAGLPALAPNVSWLDSRAHLDHAFVPQMLVGRSWAACSCAQCVLARTGALTSTSPSCRRCSLAAAGLPLGICPWRHFDAPLQQPTTTPLFLSAVSVLLKTH